MKPIEEYPNWLLVTLGLIACVIIAFGMSAFMPNTDSMIWYQLPEQFKEANK